MDEEEIKKEIEKEAKEYMVEHIREILEGDIDEEEASREVGKRYIESKSNENFEYAIKMVGLIGNKRFTRMNSKVTEINKRITDGVEKWSEEDSIIVYSYLKQGVELLEEINAKYDI